MSRFLSPLRIRFMLFLLCGTMLYFLANVQRVSVPGAVFDRLQKLYNCHPAGVAGLGAAFMYAYALMQPLTGLLLDRFGSGRILIAGGFIFAAGEFWFAGTSSIISAYCAQVLVGLGAGSLYLSLVRENMRIFHEKYNFSLSAIILLGYAGGIAANAPFLLVINRFGLRGAFILSASCIFLFWLLCLGLLLPGKFQAEKKQRTFSPREFLPVLRTAHNRKLFIFGALNFGLFYVLQTVIGKKFLQDFCEMPDLKASWVFSATGAIAASCGFLFALLGQLTGGRKRIFCRIAGVTSISVFAAIFLLIAANVRSSTVYVGLLLLLSATASLTTVLVPMLKETNPPEQVGKSISLMNFSFYLAIAMLGNLTGVLLNCFTPVLRNGTSVYGRETWLTISGVMLFASFFVFYNAFQMQETRRRKK